MNEILDVFGGLREWACVESDCLPFLRSLPAESIDLVCGSPPYAKARKYLDEGLTLSAWRKPQEWVAWMVEVVRESVRVSRGLVVFVIEGRTKNFRYDCTPFLLMADLHRAGFHLRKPCVFKRSGMPGGCEPDWLRNDWEPILCVSRPGKLPWSDNRACAKAPKYPANENGRGKRNWYPKTDRRAGDVRPRTRNKPAPALANPGNVLSLKVGAHNMGHELCHKNEAPFPEALPEFFIRSFCRPGGIVCDPFSGSGTTAAMAVQHGRRFVGCDLRASQVELTARRMATVTPAARALAMAVG